MSVCHKPNFRVSCKSSRKLNILHLTTIKRLIVTKHVRIGAHMSIAIHENVVFWPLFRPKWRILTIFRSETKVAPAPAPAQLKPRHLALNLRSQAQANPFSSVLVSQLPNLSSFRSKSIPYSSVLKASVALPRTPMSVIAVRFWGRVTSIPRLPYISISPGKRSINRSCLPSNSVSTLERVLGEFNVLYVGFGLQLTVRQVANNKVAYNKVAYNVLHVLSVLIWCYKYRAVPIQFKSTQLKPIQFKSAQLNSTKNEEILSFGMHLQVPSVQKGLPQTIMVGMVAHMKRVTNN